MRRLRIIGSYSGYGTKIVDVETGGEIHNVRSITWTHSAGQIPTCQIELVNVSLESEADDVTSPMSTVGRRHRILTERNAKASPATGRL